MCQPGNMALTPRTDPFNVPIDLITRQVVKTGYRQVVFQFSIINLTNRIRNGNLSTPPQLTACHKLHSTTFHYVSTSSSSKYLHYEECPRFKKKLFDYLRHFSVKFLLALAD